MLAMKAWFLPIGLVLALIWGLSAPGLGTSAYLWRFPGESGLRLVDWNVIVVFIISGWQLRSTSMEGLGPYARAIICAIIINLCIAPLLVLGVGLMGIFPAVLFVGAAVMSCMPTTLASGIVISGQAGGDEGLSLIITIILSMIGVLILPFSIGFLLDVGNEINIEVWPLIKKLAMIVLLPFGIGTAIRLKWGRPQHKAVGYIPLTAIIIIVWAVASSKQDAFMNATAWTVFASMLFGILIHVLLLLIAFVTARVQDLPLPIQKSLVIISSQKTLPIAVAIFTMIEPFVNAEQMGLGIMICVIWHFSQTIIDSMIAAKWSKKVEID